MMDGPNCFSRSFQSRIDELPTNRIPPVGGACCRSAAAKAAMFSSNDATLDAGIAEADV
jgi:hypothetical protein